MNVSGRHQAIILTNDGILLIDKLQWHFDQISYMLIQGIAFENVVRKMEVILSRPQCVNFAVNWWLWSTIIFPTTDYFVMKTLHMGIVKNHKQVRQLECKDIIIP